MLRTGQNGERGVVSVLVFDVVNSTRLVERMSVDDAEAFSDVVLEYVRRPVDRLGGIITNFAGDGGTAIFGWPHSLEDHAYCAIQAAWDIQHMMAEDSPFASDQEIRFRAGVHTGLIGLRRIELDTGARFDTSGGVVHLAAQLEKRAEPGGILISAQTLSLCRDQIRTEPVGEDRFRVIAPPRHKDFSRLDSKFTKPIFGRKDELETAMAALTAPAPARATCAIWGEPGIGKSRLSVEALRQLRQTHFDEVLVCLVDRPGGFRPFDAITTLLREASGVGHRASNATLHEALHLDSADAETRRLVSLFLIPAKARAPRESSAPTPLQTGRALVNALLGLLKGRRTLLVIEDYHLIDPESVQALRMLTDHCTYPDLAMLVTSRPETAEAIESLCAQTIELVPLPPRDLAQFAGEDHPANMTTLAELSGGNPLHMEQLLISPDASRDRSVPLSIESLVHARLNALDPNTKTAAQSLSVMGDDVELDLARRVLKIGMDELHMTLRKLDQFAITSLPTAGRIRFRHSLVARACANSLTRHQLQGLHKETMFAIQTLNTDLSPHYERLAYHAEQASQRDHALEFLWLAVLQAKRQSANQSVFRLFEWAMALFDGHEAEHAELYVDFVVNCYDALQQIGKYDQVRSHLEHAVALSRENDWPLRLGALLGLLGMIYWIDGRYDDGIEVNEAAEKVARDCKSLPLGVNAAFVKSLSLHGSGRVSEAIEIQSQLVESLSGPLENKRLGTAGIPSVITRGFLAWACSDSRDALDWEPQILRALDVARAEEEVYSEIAALLGQTRCLLRADRVEEAITASETALALAYEYGFHAAKSHMAGLNASALARGGEPARALAVVRSCYDSGHAHAAGNLAFFALQNGHAEALLAGDSLDSAHDLALAAVTTARGHGNPALLADGLHVLGKVLRQQGLCEPSGAAWKERDALIETYSFPLAPEPER